MSSPEVLVGDASTLFRAPDLDYLELIEVTVQDLGEITGTVSTNPQTHALEAFVEEFYATTPNKGSGKELLRIFMQKSLELGAVTISGCFITPQALGAFASVIGIENLSFRYRLSTNSASVDLESVIKNPENYVTSASLQAH